MNPGLKVLLTGFVLSFTALLVHAQPTVISPTDVARFNQLTTVSDNFANGVDYDLQSPMELRVSIYRLILPEGGVAQVVFKINELGEGAESYGFDHDTYHIGTLQISEKVKAKKLNKNKFEDGAPAVLFAWPASEWNQSASQFLVDELVLLNSDQRYVFQLPDQKLKKHRKSTGIDSSF